MTTEEKTGGQQGKKIQVPHQLIIILIIVALATLATYVVPAGKYDTVMINGRKAISATSFHFIKQTPVSPWNALLALPQGFIQQVKIIVMVVMIAASMGVISATGAFDATIGRITAKHKNNLNVIIPALMGCFALLGMMGINTPIIAFIPLALILGYNLGGDALIGVSLGLMGMTCGLAGGAFCTSSTAIAQGLVGLPQFSGWQLRLAATICFWLVGSFYLIRYTKKVQKDPTKSIVYGVQGLTTSVKASNEVELTQRRMLALVAFLIGFVVVVYGATHGWSTSDQIPVVFMLTAVVCGAISGFSPNEICKQFIKGAQTMMGPSIVIAFATGINIILTKGNVLHTLVNALSSLFVNSSTYVAALGLYVCNLLINFVICSSSGQATTVIPIFSAMGDVLHLTQQTIVQTFNFGDAITNVVTPLSSTLMASIGFAGVPLNKWLKFVWKWLLLDVLIAAVFVVIGVAISYGPF